MEDYNENIKENNTICYSLSFDAPYISSIRKNLEEIQSKDGSNIKYTFYDGKRDQNIQNDPIDSVTQKDYDLLLVNLVSLDENTVMSGIDKVKQKIFL